MDLYRGYFARVGTDISDLFPFRYAIKANGNLHIVKELKAQGVQMLITVSGYEIVAGLNVGFPPEDIIFNGNGKQR